jgi:hypothetical protein
LQTAARSLSRLSAALFEGSQGSVSFGKVQHGVERSGRDLVADGSTEGASPLCCSLGRVVEAGQCTVRLGAAWLGMARYGKVKVADGSTGGLGFLCCSL